MSEEYLIISDPDVCGGKPVVRGTRVPVQYILELSERGYEVHRIHEEYPTVPKEVIAEVVKRLRESKVLKFAH